MSLAPYFESLIQKLEQSDISNAGKDANGFFKPTRAVLLQNLNLLKDLHQKNNPQAKAMIRKAWDFVVENVPSEWLILNDQQKKELKKALG